MAAWEPEAASFPDLLWAALDPAGGREAEERLRRAEEASPVRFLARCAAELGREGAPPALRQLAALLLKNAVSSTRAGPRDRTLAARWVDGVPEEEKEAVKRAILMALQDREQAVWSCAAVAAAKIGAMDVPMGRWGELVPLLQQWAEGGDQAMGAPCARVPSLRALGYLAEEWWYNFTPERGGREVSASVRCMLAATLRCVGEGEGPPGLRAAACEALFHVLGCAQASLLDPGESKQVIGRILHSCCPAGPAELAAPALRCLGRLAAEYYDLLGPHLEDVAPVTWAAIEHGSEYLATLGIEFWSSIANLELMPGPHSRGYIAKALPALVPRLLHALSRGSVAGGAAEPRDLLDSASGCLATVARLSGQPCLDIVLAFLGAHFESPELRLRRAALLAYGAMVEAPQEGVTAIVVRSFGVLLPALSDATLQRAAAWAAGRALEFHGRAIPAASRAGLLPASLALAADADLSQDFGYVLEGLMASAAVSGEQFLPTAARLLEDSAKAGPCGRATLLGALAALVRGAGEECRPRFGELLLALLRFAEERQARQVDGVGACLQALTERLGGEVASCAVPMVRLYVAVLDAGVAQGVGMHDETLWAAGALVRALGPGASAHTAALWPALSAAMLLREQPQSCAAGFAVFGDLCSAAGAAVHPYAEVAQDRCMDVLRSPGHCQDLRRAAVACLGRLCRALGGELPGVELALEALGDLAVACGARESPAGRGAAAAPPASAAGAWRAPAAPAPARRPGCPLPVQRMSDGWLRRRELADALMAAYADVVQGLRETSSLAAAQEHLPTVLRFITAKVAVHGVAEDVLLSACRVLGGIAQVHPRAVSDFCFADECGCVTKLLGFALGSPDPQVRELGYPLAHLRDPGPSPPAAD